MILFKLLAKLDVTIYITRLAITYILIIKIILYANN